MDRIITVIMPDGGKHPFYKGDVKKSLMRNVAELGTPGAPSISTEAYERLAEILSNVIEEALRLKAQTKNEISLDEHLSIIEKCYVALGERFQLFDKKARAYFPVPSEMSKLTSGFGIGLKKYLSPIAKEEIDKGYDARGTNYTYFSLAEKQTRVTLQYSLFEDQELTKLQSHEKTLQEALGPYGLKVFYSLLCQCDDNKRQPWFYLDINHALDRMGHKRDSKGRHESKNRERYVHTIEQLSKVKWNIESHTTDPKNKKLLNVKRITGPLINITAEMESFKVSSDNTDDIKSKIVKDGMRITIEPGLYEEIDTRFTKFPQAYLAIDANRKPFQIFFYAYINHQWRIGWHEHKGTIKNSLQTIIQKAGIPIPKRQDKRLDFVKRVLASLIDMKDNRGLWIEDVKIEPPKKPKTGRVKEIDRLLGQIVTITASEDHPLRSSMNDSKKISHIIPPETSPPGPASCGTGWGKMRDRVG